MKQVQRVLLLGFILVALAGVMVSFESSLGTTPPADGSQIVASSSETQHLRSGFYAPIEVPPTDDERKVALGKRLFSESRLSKNNQLSCAHCHDFKRGGVDRMPVSIGIEGRAGSVNAPTVFNARFNLAQFWDGRAETLEAQAMGPIHNSVEMGSNWSEIESKLGADKSYVTQFERIYSDGMTLNNLVDAIAAFERTLVTPNARFDQYLRGDKQALDIVEQRGLYLFTSYGCASCHQGVALGGNLYQQFGIMGDYFAERQSTEADLGRFNVTQREEDRHVFKVPSLRNVAVTPPYFHDGSVNKLETAVYIMARYQLGRDISFEDTRAITAFLHTLTGEWEGSLLR